MEGFKVTFVYKTPADFSTENFASIRDVCGKYDVDFNVRLYDDTDIHDAGYSLVLPVSHLSLNKIYLDTLKTSKNIERYIKAFTTY